MRRMIPQKLIDFVKKAKELIGFEGTKTEIGGDLEVDGDLFVSGDVQIGTEDGNSKAYLNGKKLLSKGNKVLLSEAVNDLQTDDIVIIYISSESLTDTMSIGYVYNKTETVCSLTTNFAYPTTGKVDIISYFEYTISDGEIHMQDAHQNDISLSEDDEVYIIKL